MTRYLLDTNIISDATKPLPSTELSKWFAEESDESLFISSFTIAEIRCGILEKPKGKKRRELETWFIGPEGPRALFAGRILPFDATAALKWAELIAAGKAAGRPRNKFDMIIASVELANACIIVTYNERDFFGLPVLNPVHSG